VTYPAVPPPPSGAMPTRPSSGRTVLSYVWAFIPLISLGLATPAVFLYAAVRLKTALQWLGVAMYGALWTILLVTLDSAAGSSADNVFTVVLFAMIVGGTTHALIIRSRVFSAVRPGPNAFDAALDAARDRRAVRAQARELVERDQVMARELRIGRPDLPRSFDDGGLIDVNSAPPAVLAQLPGLTPVLVDRIVRTREQVGGFVSAEELSATAGLPPQLTPQIAEYAVFLA
jgi:hypothetical protein